MMDRISAYRELIRKNIDYENYPPIYNKQEVDELIELIVETLMLPPDAGTIRIGVADRQAEHRPDFAPGRAAPQKGAEP